MTIVEGRIAHFDLIFILILFKLGQIMIMIFYSNGNKDSIVRNVDNVTFFAKWHINVIILEINFFTFFPFIVRFIF